MGEMTPGHHELDTHEAQLVREVRKLGRNCEDLLESLRAEDVDQRWLAIAKTHMQEGIMAAVRAVTKPEFF